MDLHRGSGTPARSTTTAKLAKSAVASNKRATLTVTIKPTTAMSATGDVVVKEKQKTLVSVQLSSGDKNKITIKLPKLKPGIHKIRAVFSGDKAVSGSQSSVATLTVRKH